MDEKKSRRREEDKGERQTYRVRLPGFITDQDIGLGDVLKAPAPETPAGGKEVIAPSYIYALGRVEPRFPSPAVEKELARATARVDTAELMDRRALHKVLSQRQNRYLARKLRWLLTIEGLETYILQPRDRRDYEMLVEAVRPAPSPTDVDIVIGERRPIAPPEMCNGLLVPIVIFDQIYSFDRDALIKAIPRPKAILEDRDKQFRAAAEELFDRITHMSDNTGAMDEHRALNYLGTRYDAIYARSGEAYSQNYLLTGVEARPSRLSDLSKVVDVIFTYTQHQTDFTEKYCVRVDVTQEFPFLVTRMQPFYER